MYKLDVLIQGYPGKTLCHGGLGWSTIALLRGGGRSVLTDVGAFAVRPEFARQLAAAASPEEAGDRLFGLLRLPPSRWKPARTANAIERLHEESKRRIKAQTVLPSAETSAMLFRALLASGQIAMRKVDGRRTPAEKPAAAVPLDLAARRAPASPRLGGVR